MSVPDPGDGPACPAYTELARQHLPDLLTVAQWLASHPGHAAELTHASLCEGFRRFDEFNGHVRLRTWLLGIMCELCEVDGDGDREPGVADAGPCPTDLRRTGEAGALPTLVRALPGRLRRPLVLCDITGLSYREIAAVLRIPVGAVRSRIWRGRRTLFGALGAAPEAEQWPSALRLASE